MIFLSLINFAFMTISYVSGDMEGILFNGFVMIQIALFAIWSKQKEG